MHCHDKHDKRVCKLSAPLSQRGACVIMPFQIWPYLPNCVCHLVYGVVKVSGFLLAIFVHDSKIQDRLQPKHGKNDEQKKWCWSD